MSVVNLAARVLWAAALAMPFAAAPQQTVDEAAEMRPRFVTGRVVLQDGSPPPAPVHITVSTMNSIELWSGYTDKQGRFMCQVAGETISAHLEGFRVHEVKRDLQYEREFLIVLRPVSGESGSTVSVADLKAPPKARQAYRRGAAALAKQKWGEAQQNLEKAAELYPDYAAAWNDLGVALEKQGKAPEAGAAYSKALAADPKFIPPYLHMAELAINASKWEEAAQITSRLLMLNPLDFPAAYFYDAAANFKLNRLGPAEQSARRAIEIDAFHAYPRSEYLLGTILAVKGDHRGAAEHMRKYLELAPASPEAEQVKKQLADLDRRVHK